ncbi:MAG: HD domain-containing phosphohydrolase [Chloroflexales bacterium]
MDTPHDPALAEAIQSVLAALEHRDPGAVAHAWRVANLAARLAAAVGFEEAACAYLWYAGLLHDVGKLAVRDAVLRKPGPLSVAERTEIETHPVYGGRWLRGVPTLRPCVPAVRHHHEHWDGSGYPDHLAGQAIPLAARILSIADVYAAVTSERVYQTAWATPQALALIATQAGSLFDPALVLTFLRLAVRTGLPTA